MKPRTFATQTETWKDHGKQDLDLAKWNIDRDKWDLVVFCNIMGMYWLW